MKKIICKIILILTANKICLNWCDKNCKLENTKQMARKVVTSTYKSSRKKRRGCHSKNASKGQNAYKKAYRGQGR